jgi:hypothetical protein
LTFMAVSLLVTTAATAACYFLERRAMTVAPHSGIVCGVMFRDESVIQARQSHLSNVIGSTDAARRAGRYAATATTATRSATTAA